MTKKKGAGMGKFTYEELLRQLESARTYFGGMAATADGSEDGSWEQEMDALAEAMDIIYDYRKQGDRLSELERREISIAPAQRRGIYICQKCSRRTNPANTYCHFCGQRQRVK